MIPLIASLLLVQAPAPTADWVPCRFNAGELTFAGGSVDPARLRCGFLGVREHRGPDAPSGDGPTSRLAFVVIHANEPRPDALPLLYLIGGPGSAAIIPYVLGLEGPGLASGRDVVVFDQRGTGRSGPELCPDLARAEVRIAAADLEREDGIAALIDAERACLAELAREGHRPADYDIDANVADIEDLRRALGYERWHVYGVSFGGALAQRLMLDHPRTVASAVLVSPVPVDWSNFDETVPLAAAVLDSVYGGCTRDPHCAEAFPLGQRELVRTHADLLDRPWTVEVDSARVGSSTFTVNAPDLMAIAGSFMYNDTELRFLPTILHAFAERDAAAARQAIERVFGGREDVTGDAAASMVPQLSVWCRDAVDEGSRERFDRAAAPFPEALRDVWYVYLDVCEHWPVEPGPSEHRRPLESDVPVLIVSGGLDSIVAAASGTAMLAGLSNGRQVVFPRSAHVIPSSFQTAECLYGIVRAFLSDPDAPLDAACAWEQPLPSYPSRLPEPDGPDPDPDPQ